MGGKNIIKSMVRGNHTLIVTDRCVARIPDVRGMMLENIYEMTSESYTMYGTEL